MKMTRMAMVLALCALTGSVQANDNAGWYARIDALLLDPSINSNGFANVFRGVPSDTDLRGSLGGGLKGGYRLVGGKENCSGLGVNFQYFELDSSVNYNGEWEGATDFQFNGGIDLEVYAFDAEVTQRATFRHWDLVVGGGLRAGGVEIEQGGGLFIGPGTFYGIPSGVDFDGVGPTISVAAERPLGNSGLEIVGRARASLLFGQLEQTATFGGAAPPIFSTTSDDLVQVTEIQFGMNYDRQIGSATGTFGVFWEAQRWDSDSDALGDLGLHGLSLQSGLLY